MIYFYSNSGRKLTSQGQRDMDRIAGQVEIIIIMKIEHTIDSMIISTVTCDVIIPC